MGHLIVYFQKLLLFPKEILQEREGEGALTLLNVDKMKKNNVSTILSFIYT